MPARTFIYLFFFVLFLGSCEDEKREEQLIDRAESFLKTDPDSTYALLERIALPENLSDPLLARWCMLYGKAADTLHAKMPYSHQLTRALDYYKKKGDPFDQAQIGLYLGRSYVEDKEWEKAAATYVGALNLALHAKNYNQAGYISAYMGDLYDLQDMHTLAIEKYGKAAGYFLRAGNNRSHVLAMRDIARMYVFADSSEAALEILQQTETIAAALKDSLALSDIYNALGNVYSSLNQTGLAEKYLWASLRADSSDSAPNYLALAEVYRKNKNFEKARSYAQKAAAGSSINANVPFSASYIFYLIEKEEKNFEQALAALEHFQIMLDSLGDLKNKNNILQVEKKYDHLKILSENMRLKVEKQHSSMLLILLFLLLAVVVLIYQIKIKKEKYKIYEQQKALDEKDIHLLTLSIKLQNLKNELQALSEKFEKNKEEVDIKLTIERQQAIYLQKKQEIDSLNKEIIQLRRDKLHASPVAKRLSKLSSKVIPGAVHSPLKDKDWASIEKTVNEIYLSFSDKLFQVAPALSPAEIRYCYLVFFELDTVAESILLHIAPESVSKYRQRIRNKLGMTGENKDLYTYLVNL